MEGEFLIVTQVSGESPGLMEVYGFYDSEGELVNHIKNLKRDKVAFGVYRIYEAEAAEGGDGK